MLTFSSAVVGVRADMRAVGLFANACHSPATVFLPSALATTATTPTDSRRVRFAGVAFASTSACTAFFPFFFCEASAACASAARKQS